MRRVWGPKTWARLYSYSPYDTTGRQTMKNDPISQVDDDHRPVIVENTHQHIIPSVHVDQNYHIPVALPASYCDLSKSFPVLYLLDTDKSFGMAQDIVGWLSWAGEIPELLVVGITYGEGTDACWQKRSRDYTPTKDRSRVWGDWPLAGGWRLSLLLRLL
jgi:hypothetical protein